MGNVWKWGGRGRRQLLAEPRATSPTTGAACPASASARTAMRSLPGRAIGTIPTCWSWARSGGDPRCIPRTSSPTNRFYAYLALVPVVLAAVDWLRHVEHGRVHRGTAHKRRGAGKSIRIPLGKPAGRISKNGQTEVWARPLFDGFTTAVGLFNQLCQPGRDGEGLLVRSRARRCPLNRPRLVAA